MTIEEIKYDIEHHLNLNHIKSYINNHRQYQDFLKGTWYKNLNNLIKCIKKNIILQNCKCLTCKKQLTIQQALRGTKYCNGTCRNNNSQWRQNYKQICLQKYGVQNPSLSKEIRQKANQTNFKLYGAYNVRQSDTIKRKIKQINKQKYGVQCILSLKEIHEKAKQKMMEKYGVQYGFQSTTILKKCIEKNKSEIIQTKKKQTCLKKYGKEYITQIPEIINKKTLTRRIKTFNKKIMNFKHIKPNFTLEQWLAHNHKFKFQWICNKCGDKFIDSMQNGHIPICRHCYPIIQQKISKMEKEVFYFIQSIYSNQIIQNDRKIINPLQLDIVLPKLKLAIEINGTYWHSTKFKDSNYHLNKTILCQKAGYRLIHIFQNEWLEKTDIIKAKLKSIICSNQSSIYARKCIIKQINTKIKNEFLNNNHIQGQDKSNIKLGLFYQNELVAVMTFCKSRFNKHYEWELSRYATSKRVIGGAGKLLSYFQKNYNPNSIVTYADRRYSIGNMYQKLGFNLDHISKPNYWYCNNYNILTRHQCQKQKLKHLLKQNFNQNLTEYENMLINNYYKIFDCGTLVYVKKLH